MFGVTTHDDYRPVTWVGGFAVDVTTLLVAAHIICLVLTCFAIALGGGGFINWLGFDSAQVLHSGAVHQILTYAFIHPPSAIIWFAVEMYLLFTFGREVERFLGRRAFLALYALLLIVPSLALVLWGLGERVGLAGSQALHFGIFVSFAAIYPNTELFVRLNTKWVAVVLAAAYTLQLLAYRVWSEMAVLWLSIAIAFLFVRMRGAGPELEWWTGLKEKLQPKPKFHVVPRASPRRVVEPEDVYDSIDPLLDKISKSGINSLTPSERRTLDRARNQLLKKSE
jgi:hypothetical protein